MVLALTSRPLGKIKGRMLLFLTKLKVAYCKFCKWKVVVFRAKEVTVHADFESTVKVESVASRKHWAFGSH